MSTLSTYEDRCILYHAVEKCLIGSMYLFGLKTVSLEKSDSQRQFNSPMRLEGIIEQSKLCKNAHLVAYAMKKCSVQDNSTVLDYMTLADEENPFKEEDSVSMGTRTPPTQNSSIALRPDYPLEAEVTSHFPTIMESPTSFLSQWGRSLPERSFGVDCRLSFEAGSRFGSVLDTQDVHATHNASDNAGTFCCSSDSGGGFTSDNSGEGHNHDSSFEEDVSVCSSTTFVQDCDNLTNNASIGAHGTREDSCVVGNSLCVGGCRGKTLGKCHQGNYINPEEDRKADLAPRKDEEHEDKPYDGSMESIGDDRSAFEPSKNMDIQFVDEHVTTKHWDESREYEHSHVTLEDDMPYSEDLELFLRNIEDQYQRKKGENSVTDMERSVKDNENDIYDGDSMEHSHLIGDMPDIKLLTDGISNSSIEDTESCFDHATGPENYCSTSRL